MHRTVLQVEFNLKILAVCVQASLTCSISPDATIANPAK